MGDLYMRYNYGRGNFGDAINLVFWSKITQRNIRTKFDYNIQPHFLTTGSIMELATDKSIIFGSGFISQNSNLGGQVFSSNSNKKICNPLVLGVRGRLTREKLLNFSVPCPKVYGDPLLMFPLIYNPKVKNDSSIIGILPHYIDYKNENLKEMMSQLLNKGHTLKKINIITGSNYKNFVDSILSCGTIITSSLHGLIFGLLYNKKTIFIRLSDKVVGNGFKFLDFFSSLSIKYNTPSNMEELLDLPISLDKNKLFNIQQNLIESCPIIEKNRKLELQKML